MSVQLISKIGRKTPRNKIVYIEHTVRLEDGSIPKDLSLVKPLQDTKNMKNGSLYPVDDSYDKVRGVYRQEFEIIESKDSDIETTYSVTGKYKSTEVDGFINFSESFRTSLPEPAPIVNVTQVKAEDNKFIIIFGVKRANGKIPSKVTIPLFATRYDGLADAKYTNKCYNPKTGELKVEYKISPKLKSVSIDLVTEIGLGDGVPTTPTTYTGTVDVVRLIAHKVISTTLVGKIMSVVIQVKWVDDNTIPNDFNLKSPFILGTNVPTGTVDPKTVSYDKVTGMYMFDVKVDTVPSGRVEYTFVTKGIVVGYPDIDFEISFGYNHQNIFSADLQQLDLRSGRLYATWKIKRKDVPDYQLEYFSRPGAPFLSLGCIGDPKGRITWMPKTSSLTLDWEVESSCDQEQLYDFRGEFLADAVTFPWTFKLKVPAASTANETLARIDNSTMSYSFDLVCDGKIRDVDTSGIHIWINDIPTTTRIIQDESNPKNKISAHFPLPLPEIESINIKVIGSLRVDAGYLRQVPVNFGKIEYIPLPEVGPEIELELIDYEISNDKEILTVIPTFKNGYCVGAIELKEGSLTSNGRQVTPSSVKYKDGKLVIVSPITLTGNREEFHLAGDLIIPHYNNTELTHFSFDTEYGSNTFPATYNAPYLFINKDNGVVQFIIRLKDGTSPKNVKIKEITNPNNVVIDNLINLTEFYNPDSGLIAFNITLKAPVDKAVRYGFDIDLDIDDGESIEPLSIKVAHVEPAPVIIETGYLGYTVKNNVIQFTHRLIVSTGLPKTVNLIFPIKIMEGCKEICNFKYDYKTGLITYNSNLQYTSGGLPVQCLFDIGLGGTRRTVSVDTGRLTYSPAAKATYLSHYFEEKKGKQILVYSWLFRDSINEIPDNIIPAGRWSNNVNLCCSDLLLNYDKVTGIGSVSVESKRDLTSAQNFFVETKFKFPSPDVNEYPLSINFTEEAVRSKLEYFTAKRISAPKFTSDGTQVELTYNVNVTNGIFTKEPEIAGKVIDLEGNLILNDGWPESTKGDLTGTFTVVLNIDKANSKYPFVKFRFPIGSEQVSDVYYIEDQFATPVNGIEFAGIELLPKTTTIRFRWASSTDTLFKPTSPFMVNKNILVNTGRFLRNINGGFWYIDLYSVLNPKRDMVYSISTKEGISGSGVLVGTEKQFITMFSKPYRTLLNTEKTIMTVEYHIGITGGGKPTELEYELIESSGNYNDEIEPIVTYNSASGVLGIIYAVEPYMEKHLYSEAIVSIYDPFVVNKMSVLMIGKTS